MNQLVEDFYNKMPTGIQNICISMYGYYWKKKRLGGLFNKYLEEIRNREYFTYDQWQHYQTLQLRKILVHAYKSVPYYLNKFKNAGIDLRFLENITLNNLKMIPCTTKDDFRKYCQNFMLSKKRARGVYFSSSGSTGTPTHIYTPDYFSQQAAAYMEARVLNWAGVGFKYPRGMVGGRRILPESNMTPPYYRYNVFEKQTYFSAYHISENTIENYLNGIIENKVAWMHGYAMSNFYIADFIKKAGLKAPQLKAVITSSEKLTEEMRAVISSVFKCRVYDSYSGGEFCGLISESSKGELLVSPDVGIMEFVDQNGRDVSNGQIGEIISTGFINYDQPLIRYKIGDLAKVSISQTLLTNHNMTKIDEIIGRVEDTVIGKDGRKMVRFHSLFIDIPGLIQSQLIQKTFTDFDIKLIIDKSVYNYTESEQTISKRLKSQIGEVSMNFLYVTSIPAEKNGKVKAVISFVA